MTIQKKIVLSTTLMVALAVLLSLAGVLMLLNKGIKTQTRVLLAELELQSRQRLQVGEKVLQNIMSQHIQRINYVTADACRDQELKEPLTKGQWKALFAKAATASATAGIDFMVIFDTKGKVASTFPALMDEAYPEAHFRELELFRHFAAAIADKNLTATSVVSSFERWDQETLKAYNIDGNDDGDIVVLSAGIIPNDFFDEPIGYILSGIQSSRLSGSFDYFFKTTGQFALLTDKNIPQVWAGIAGSRKELTGWVHAFDPIHHTALGKVTLSRARVDKKAYHYVTASLVDLFATNDIQGAIRVDTEASLSRIIVGEPAGLIDDASNKIIAEGVSIRNKILVTTLLIALAVLVLTTLIMGLISRKIVGPIALAAHMSNKIASGDLTPVLDESSADETGMLSKSMNRMAKNLNTLIAENKNQVKALEESEKRNKSIVTSIQDGVLLIDAHTHEIIEANPAALKMIGAQRHEVIGHRCNSFICPAKDGACPITDMGQTLDHSEHLLLTIDGRQTEVLKTSVSITMGDRECLLETMVDLSRIKRTEAALRDSERRFRTLFNTSHQAIALVETETGRFIDANDKLCDISKYPKNEIIGKTATQLGFYSRDEEMRLTRQLSHTSAVYEREMDFHAKDGSIVNILFYATPIRIKDKNFFLTEFHDITEKNRLESQLKQSQKMESIGTLAGGIAHDFNNILYIIIGNLDLALASVPEWNPAHKNLKEIEAASKRASDIVKQILNFSRKTDQDLKLTRILAVAQDSLVFLRSATPSFIDIKSVIQAKDRSILADPVQINQIILNLCINASQEMQTDGGTLEFIVEDETITAENLAQYPELTPGDHVKISVGDTGPGTDPKVIDRIFDPYFTTKEIGKGSGMGLSVVHGIVKNHGGAIRVNNRPGNGAVFTILFPVAVENLPPSLPDKISHEIPCGNESILFVDDEKAIVTMTQTILERLSYTVVGRTNPVEAWELFQSDPLAFDLVITDMTMPQMTGITLLEKIQGLRPDIPVIICTGHSPLINDELAKKMQATAYISKPIVIEEMARTLRKVLDVQTHPTRHS